MNKRNEELAVSLVEAWLAHESQVSNEIGQTSVKGRSISVKEVAQAYIDIYRTVCYNAVPGNLKNEE